MNGSSLLPSPTASQAVGPDEPPPREQDKVPVTRFSALSWLKRFIPQPARILPHRLWDALMRRCPYRVHYQVTRGRYWISSTLRKRSPAADVAYVLPERGRGWILEAICREIQTHYDGSSILATNPKRLPRAKTYFFAHYATLPVALRHNPHAWGSRRLVWYTHPREELSGPELFYALNRATTIFSTCTEFQRMLVRQGVSRCPVVTVLGAADPSLFRPHERGGGAVGFCTAYYARKEPERILRIVRSMPHRRFILLGRNWKEYDRFHELHAMPNFEYLEAPYSEYPKFYARLDVFVSPARLEGGPIPLIEAMMSNVVPVASRTGFAPDIIEHGRNGFIFDVDAEVPAICRLIEQAFALPGDVRQTVEHLTWERFSREMQQYF